MATRTHTRTHHPMGHPQRNATRTTVSSSVTSMDDASFEEFKAAQDRRFAALQHGDRGMAAFKAAQMDGFQQQHQQPRARSPPVKEKQKQKQVQEEEETMMAMPEPETALTIPDNRRHRLSRTASSLRASTVLTQQTADARAQLSLLELQMRQAELEIERARDVVKGLEAQRDDAERAASHAKKVARRLHAENLALVAKEQGRKEGYETGFGHGRVVAMAKVEKEREKRRVAKEREEQRKRAEQEEAARRRQIEAPPPPPPPPAPAPAPTPPAQVEEEEEQPEEIVPQQQPIRRSSLRTQPLERSRSVSTPNPNSDPDPTQRTRATSLRRVSIVADSPAVGRAASMRSAAGPINPSSYSLRSAGTRHSAAGSVLTSLDSLGLGTPRAMPVTALMPQPPLGWAYYEDDTSVTSSQVHVPMRPPPHRSSVPMPVPITIPATTVPVAEERNRTPTSVASSVSASLRNLNLTSFPAPGRERELSVIMETAHEGSSRSPSAAGSTWASPYADPQGGEMEQWRRSSEVVVPQVQVQEPQQQHWAEMPVPEPAIPIPAPVVPPPQQQQQASLSPYAIPPPRPGAYVPGMMTQGGNPSQDTLLRRSSSGSTVNITVVPPSRPTSTGQQAQAQPQQQHYAPAHPQHHPQHPEDDSDSDTSDESDDIRPPIGFGPGASPLPAFARGVPSGFVPGAGPGGGAGVGARPPSRQGAALYAPAPASSLGPGGFTVESGRPASRQGHVPQQQRQVPLLGTQGSFGGFDVEPARPASRNGNPAPTAVPGSWSMGPQFGFGQQQRQQPLAEAQPQTGSWNMGPQFGFGQQQQQQPVAPQPQPFIPSAADLARSTTPRPGIYAGASPSTGAAPLPVPAPMPGSFYAGVAGSTGSSTASAHRRRASVGVTPGPARPLSRASSSAPSAMRKKGNHTPHPSVGSINLGRANPYTDPDDDEEDEAGPSSYGRGGPVGMAVAGSDGGSEVSSLGMAELTMQNTFQNAARAGGREPAMRRQSGSASVSQRTSIGTSYSASTGRGGVVPPSPAHSYRPMR
ncbi:hypothetical protein MIND_00203700 [Mycena indigotica]|uniref:Uncharacterized protein n=1 Tax=Mycena indigotica TaxID=2126181 RepID=A0A8H6T538_9AGAR|nr:uncharacterized protein MIND_00203700 [Mycena indigotica]KAF7311923.1 hypothetical protein MIND_00203700 [Mycena indigotica]